MQYAVIYTVDTSVDADVERYAPPQEDELWDQTEGDSDFEVPDQFYDDAKGKDYYGWKEGSHRKWYAVLSQEQFDEFVDKCWLHVVGEGSSLGAVGYGFTSAVVFKGYDDEKVITEAFVTPVCPESELSEWLTQRGQHTPACLVDTPGQKYLVRGVKDKRSAWEAVYETLERAYS